VSHTFQADAGFPSAADRRTYPRRRVLLSAVELGDENGGIVLNLSEGGLALHAVSEVTGVDLPNFRFQFSQTDAWVETKGRITWRSVSKKAAGVEFIDLPGDARRQIQEWIALTSDASGIETKAAPRKKSETTGGSQPFVTLFSGSFSKPFSTSFSTSDSSIADKHEAGRAEAADVAATSDSASRPGTLRRLVLPLLLLVLVLVSALAFVIRTRQKPQPALQSAATAVQAGAPPPPSESLVNLPVALPPSVDTPGYVLQVGALAREQDADALAASLQKKKFPAFVFRRDGSRLYHVVVGPYNKADSLAAANKLEDRGFDVIRSEWKPEEQ
jgi:SPOR domain/PilZ domain